MADDHIQITPREMLSHLRWRVDELGRTVVDNLEQNLLADGVDLDRLGPARGPRVAWVFSRLARLVGDA